jgi:hypothetical protein
MRPDQRSDPRNGRWRGRAASALLALALTGCGAATVVATGGDPVPVGGAPGPGERVAAAGPGSAEPATRLPDELVGTWSGDDAQGVGSWTIAFDPDGRYRYVNAQRGVTVAGQAAVAGRRLYLQPEGADSRTLTWQVADGRLDLDGEVYRRVATGGQDDGRALVGSWLGGTGEAQRLTFRPDGTYDVAGPSGELGSGTYSVDGDRLLAGRSTYTWSVDGARLELALPDGRVLTYARVG